MVVPITSDAKFNDQMKELDKEICLKFMKRYINLTKDPIRSAICHIAREKYVNEYLTVNKIETSSKSDEESGSFTLRHIADLVQKISRTIHHHIRKLVEADILDVVSKGHPNLFRLSEKYYNYQEILSSRDINEFEYRKIGFISNINDFMGYLYLTRIHIKKISESEDYVSKFNKWQERGLIILTYRLTEEETDRFISGLDEILNTQAEKENLLKEDTKRTFGGYLFVPPFGETYREIMQASLEPLISETKMSKKEYLKFLNILIENIDEPLRAAIFRMAINKRIFGYFDALSPKDSPVIKEHHETGAFTSKDVAKQLNIKANHANFHIKKMIEAGIFKLARTKQIEGKNKVIFTKNYYELSEKFIKYIKSSGVLEGKEHSFLWYLRHISVLIGELAIIRIRIEVLDDEKIDKNYFDDLKEWFMNNRSRISKFLVTEEQRKDYQEKAYELLKTFEIVSGHPQSPEETYMSFFMIPPIE